MLVTIGIIFALCAAFYWFIQQKYDYWRSKGVLGPEPKLPFGTFKFNDNPIKNMVKVYNEYKGKGPFCGLINIIQPAALALDTNFIKDVLVRDFQYFGTRGIYYNAKDDPLSAHMFSVDGPQWKGLRTKFTPTFTSGKMKYMFSTILSVTNEFKSAIDKAISANPTIEMKDLLARFTTDIIGTCAFGIECNSLTDPKAKFREMGMKFFNEPRQILSTRLLMSSFPAISRFFRIKVLQDDVAEFFMSAVKDTVNYRIKNNVQRNDFMDLAIKLLNKNKTDNKADADMEGLTINELAAQAWVFFIAGFETSSTAMSFALYELAQNQDVQEKLRQSIKDVLEKHDNKMSYEAMQDMIYLEQCINESLRKYPPIPMLLRKAIKNYKCPINDVVIETGTMIFIPAYAIQHDPNIYPDPEKYDPNRFLPEEEKKRDSFTFLPFGEGPRNCIGLRFGMMQSKVGLATLILNYKFKLNKKTPVPVTFNTASPFLVTNSGLHVDVEKI